MMGAVAYPAAHAAVMAVVLLGVRALLPDDTGLLALILLFGMGVVTYVGATLFSHTILGYDAQGIVPMIRRARRSDPTSTDSP
jgi:hypothetical protein